MNEALPTAAAVPAPRFRTYLVWLLGLLLVFYCLPVALLQLRGFERWGGSGFGPALDYGYNVQHEDADVLLFGDSTAAVNLDPLRLSSELGVKVLNLPNTGASLHVTGDLNLQQYLAHNRPPRLIVFIFTPWNLDYAHEPAGGRVYEGEEMLARHSSLRELARYTRSHVIDSLEFPFRFYAANPPAAARNFLRGENPAEEVRLTRGYADPLSRRPPLTEPCRIPLDQVRARPDDTVQALLRRYRTADTDVMVYLPPMPNCLNVSELVTRDYSALAAAPPEVLPPSRFKLDFAYAHLLPSAVPAETHSLALAIAAHRKRDPGPLAPQTSAR